MFYFNNLKNLLRFSAKLIVFAALIILPIRAQNQAPATGYTALINVNLIDGTGKPLKSGQTILIRGERIAEIGAKIKIPKEAKIIDLAGKTVIPGLIDMHGHFYTNSPGNTQFNSYPLLFLAGGVTTVRSPGETNLDKALEMRDRISRGEAIGPRVLIYAYFDHAPTLSSIRDVKSPEDAATYFDQIKDRIDGVKFYQSISEPEFAAVLDKAHKANLPVIGHLNSITAEKAINLGIDGLEHGIFAMSELTSKKSSGEKYCELANLDVNSPAVEKLINEIVKKRVAIDPTMVIFQDNLSTREPVIADYQRYLDPETAKWFPLWLKWWRSQPFGLKPNEEKCLDQALQKQMQFVKKIHDKGGIIVAGTDSVWVDMIPGYSLQREVRNLVQAGLTPIQAIKAATLNAAAALHREKELGSLEKGKSADLVVLGTDPSVNIENIGKTEKVFLKGIEYDPVQLRKSAEGTIK